jgi:hypothetical protein
MMLKLHNYFDSTCFLHLLSILKAQSTLVSLKSFMACEAPHIGKETLKLTDYV